MKTIRDINISNKRVFIRVDFNVPLDREKNITDDTRLRGVIPTIRYALDQNAKIILASHLGRPKAKPVSDFSMKPVISELERLIAHPVSFVGDCVGREVEAKISKMRPGDILLLENLRFHPEEEKDDDTFSKQLADLCDVYVNDAFAVSHRKNASVFGITRHAPVSVAGFLMEKEITYFNQAMKNPKRPLAAVIGGAKVSSKLGVLENLLNQVNRLIIGGAMANTFLKSRGFSLGTSKIEEDLVETAGMIMEKARQKGVDLYLPIDVVIADRLSADSSVKVVPTGEIPDDQMALDIGPETSAIFKKALQDAGTIVWNGPMGAFETEPFSHGTIQMIDSVTGSEALTIVGGGDTAVALHQTGKADRITYISTGGGAFLELLEGKSLPGITALEEANQ